MNEVRFSLNISPQRYLSYYQGVARLVVVNARDGRRIQFPAEHLRPFVTHEGIHGEFALQFDEYNKFVGLKQLD
jgi:hypothetical protein